MYVLKVPVRASATPTAILPLLTFPHNVLQSIFDVIPTTDQTTVQVGTARCQKEWVEIHEKAIGKLTVNSKYQRPIRGKLIYSHRR